MNREINYKCNDCNWIGGEKELEFEQVESCMGDDEIEVCPKCGSLNVTQINNNY